MQKRQQINVQQEYANEEFLEPQELEAEQTTPVQYQQSNENHEGALDKQQSSSTQETKHLNNTNTNNNPPSPSPKPTPPITKPSFHTHSLKKSTTNRSSLQQQTDSQQQIRNSLILQFKISQLQKICTTLTSANQKLLDKIEELQEENEKYQERVVELERSKFQHQQRQDGYAQSLNDSRDSGNESVEESNYRKQQSSKEESQLLGDDDEQQKLLQEEVGDIELMIKEYRQELNRAEQVNRSIKDSLSHKINQLQEQLNQTHHQLLQTQQTNSQLQQHLSESQQRNQSLQKQIQTIINSTNIDRSTHYQYYQDPTSRNRTESRSSQYMTPVQRANYQHPRGIRPSYYQQEYSQQHQQHQLNNQQNFDSSVQVELEKLIQKLVNELQHERQVKKKMTEEMKRIQKDLLDNEKEIMNKNKKIYQLEMNLLKGEKNHYLLNGNISTNSAGNGNNNITPLNTSQLHPYHDTNRNQQKTKYSIFSPTKEQTHYHNYNSPTPKDINPKIRDKYLLQQRQRINTSGVNYSPPNRQLPVSEAYTNKGREFNNLNNLSRSPNISQSPSSGQTKHLQTFSLLQLLNEPTITLTVKQKLHISLKLVQFYQQKIYQYKNYNLLMLENVLVTNFNRIKLGLVKIRVQEHKRTQQDSNLRMRKNSKDQVADGPQKVIWNLGFLLNSLLLDVPTKEDDLGMSSAEQSVLEMIDNVLDNRCLNKELFGQLKEFLDVALQQRAK